MTELAPPDEPGHPDQPEPPGPPEPPVPPAVRPPLDWSRLAVPAAMLAVVGFSIALFIQLVALRTETRADYILNNVLGKAPRFRLMLSLFAAVLVPVLLAAPLLRRRPGAEERFERAAALVGPLALLFVLVPLTSMSFSEHQLAYVEILAVFVFALEPLLRRSFEAAAWWRERLVSPRVDGRVRWWSRPWFPLAVVVTAGLAYGFINSYYTILNHHRLGTSAFDLGIYDNLMYTAMHGHPFRSPVLFGTGGGNYLAGHAEFVLMLFVPIYALHPGPETLLVLQSFLLGLAALPLYLFAKTALSRGAAAAIAVAYLLFAPLHGPNYYDFHWLPIAVFFHFWLYYAIAARKNWLVALMLLVLFSVREDIAVGTAVLGFFLILTRLRPRLGLVILTSSVVWFGLDRFVIMPLAGQWWFQNIYSGLFADGETTFASVIKTVITNPVYLVWTLLQEAKFQYALHMLAPLAFLPLRRPATALFILPGFFFTIMTTGYAPVLSISFQYTTHWIPYLFLGVVIGLHLLEQRAGVTARRAALATMMVGVLVHSFCYGALLQHQRFTGGFYGISFSMTPAEKQRYEDLKSLLAMIPRDASVVATEQENPHISTRLKAYTLRVGAVPGVDYILVGRSRVGGLGEQLSATFASGTYGLLAERGDELFLFKRGVETPGTALAKAKLGVR